MWLRIARDRSNRIVEDASKLLSEWQIATSVDGEVCVRPLCATLNYEDIESVVERLMALESITASHVVFDMSAVQTIGSPWTAVFALLIRFARFTRDCCMVSLNPRLAAMASMVVPADAGMGRASAVSLRRSA